MWCYLVFKFKRVCLISRSVIKSRGFFESSILYLMKSAALYSEAWLNNKSPKPCGLQVYSVLCNPRQSANCSVHWLWNSFCFPKGAPPFLKPLNKRQKIEGISISMPTSEVCALNCHRQWCSSVAALLLPPLLYKLWLSICFSVFFQQHFFFKFSMEMTSLQIFVVSWFF